jgi:hypothetical protein
MRQRIPQGLYSSMGLPRSSAAKAIVNLVPLTARLKSRPSQNDSFLSQPYSRPAQNHSLDRKVTR